MSKNLTRKGLALGAVVALGSTLFAGAPAFAGIESAKIITSPSAGTTYTTLIGASFELATEVDATIEADGLENKDVEDLTYLITNSSAQSLKIDLKGANAAATYGGNLKGMSGDTADLGSYESPSDFYTSAKKVIAVTGANLQSADTADVAKNLINIYSSTDSTDPFSITVQAFLDDNNNGEIDTFEYAGAARTLNFIKASSATVTTTVTSAVVGTKVLQGTVVIGNDVNNRSLVGQISIGFFKNGSVFKMRGADAATTVDTVDLSWDTTDGLKNTQYTTIASQDTRDTLAAGTYTAKAYFGVARSLIGVESAGVSTTVGTNASADNTDYLTVTPSANAIRVDADSTTVRTGTTSAVVLNTRVLETNNTTNSSPWEATASLVKTAGLKVKVTLSKGATFTAGHEVTAGGKTLTSTSGAVSYETTTDANGKVAISVSSNKGTKGDVYRVLTQVLTETGWQDGDYTDVTFADASISKIIVKEEIGSNAVLQIAKGATLPLNFEVRDNFGALASNAGTYRVNVATNGTSNAGNSALSGGKASFNLVDETLASTGNYTITAKVQKLNAAGTAYEDLTSSVSDTVVVYVGVAATAGITVPADATTGVTLEGADFVAHDLRLDANSKTYASVGFDGTAFTVSGVATTATGAAAPGALVTISAPGAQLVAANDSASTSVALLALDTVTVRASSTGAYSVDVRSHNAGDVKITVTSGSATKTVTAKFAYPSAANKDSKLTITGATTTKSGRSNSYVVTLTDKWGNVVKKTGGETIVVEQSGAGYLASTPTTVGATSGKAILNLITQPADAGLTTISVTFDVASPDADIVATKTVLVGVTASVSKAATSKATVKNASGLSVKVVRGSKSVTKTATSDNYKVSLKGGSGSVKVYVEGILVASKK